MSEYLLFIPQLVIMRNGLESSDFHLSKLNKHVWNVLKLALQRTPAVNRLSVVTDVLKN
jgi:hypothetical protein